VSVPATHVHRNISEILEQEGFIDKFSLSDTNPNELILNLKYIRSTSQSGGSLGKPCITNLKRISKPGLRIYTNHKDIPQILGGMGIIIISTSKGLMTDRQARMARLGGELICSVW
jgi:small subunit ribosomal protein S8